MFSNQRKNIGVFLERSLLEFQNLLCQGIISKAEEKGYNVAFFSTYGKYGDNDHHFEGDQMLFELPPYEQFDGVILALDTMEVHESREQILQNIQSRCKCPVVSIREIVEGASNLLVDNTTCMEGMVEHFVEKHGFTKLCFMTGPASHCDAVERLMCFQKKMADYHLPVTEHQVFYGDYWKNMGEAACDWFLGGSDMPQAILCANDHMALAVASELIRRGIRVPEEICVSGYDGLSETVYFTPSVTTMLVPFFEMGKRAVKIIDDAQKGKKDAADVFFQAQLNARESCGCVEAGGSEALLAKREHYEAERISHNRDVQFEYLSIHLGDCRTMEEIAEQLSIYSNNIWGLRQYAVCFCEDLEKRTSCDGYSDIMEMRIGIQEGKSMGAVCIPFDRQELLPEQLTDSSPQIWYFTSLHFQENCYGYEAFQFYTKDITGQLFFSWNVMVGNKIRDLLMEHKMQKLIQELENMYDRDALTGMYNRRGLENYGNSAFAEAKKDRDTVFLTVIDLDGMKQINDNFGHIEGDFALRKLREILCDACMGENISARTGGDEFVILAKGISEEDGKFWMAEMERLLDDFNCSGQKEYNIYASYGYTCRIPEEDETMESYIRLSDEAMYLNKVKNKVHRGEKLRNDAKRRRNNEPDS